MARMQKEMAVARKQQLNPDWQQTTEGKNTPEPEQPPGEGKCREVPRTEETTAATRTEERQSRREHADAERLSR